MPRRLFIIDDPDRFVAGALGEPGQRTFFLQARKGETLVTVTLEKSQVAALATRLDDLLDAVEAPPGSQPRPTAGELDQPIVEHFRVGAMALAWDASEGNVVIEAQTPTEDGEYAEVPDDDPTGPDLLRVRINPTEARRFVHGASAVLEAGRPPCPYCGQPLDPRGHFCPLRNGQPN